jgi:hypothetical protein
MEQRSNFFLICAIGWRWSAAVYRLRKQILNLFPDSTVEVVNLGNLEKIYPNAFRLAQHNGGAKTPGYGYWVWKPIVVTEFFQKLPPNSNLFYIDAGCEINPKGFSRFTKYLNILNQDSQVFFSLEDQFNKVLNDDLRQYFQISQDLSLNAKVTSATCFGLSKHFAKDQSVLSEWYRTAMSHPEKFRPDGNEQTSEFRHDQSILSAINYVRKVVLLPEELDTSFSKNQESDFFFLALRNRMPFSVAPGTLGFQVRRRYWKVQKIWRSLFLKS